MAKRWYVVQTKPNLEMFAKENLERLRYQLFYPYYEKYVLRNGLKVLIKLPLYPAYMFVRFDPQKTSWHGIGRTEGVLSLLGATERNVCSVQKGFVEALRKTSDRRGCVVLEEAIAKTILYQPGQKLEIGSGAFKGMVGICLESRANRVVLLLALLSRETRVSLPPDAVIRVADLLSKSRVPVGGLVRPYGATR